MERGRELRRGGGVLDMGNGDALDRVASLGRVALRGYLLLKRGKQVVDPLVALFPPVHVEDALKGIGDPHSLEDSLFVGKLVTSGSPREPPRRGRFGEGACLEEFSQCAWQDSNLRPAD
jgi:hypothetical protein